MSNNKFESLLELLINEENDKAEALFHEIVVEKSRDIYEGLADEETKADAKEETKEAKEETKEETKEEVKETEASEEKKDEEVKETEATEVKNDEVKTDEGVFTKPVEAEKTSEESIEEVGGDATDELIKDISSDEEGEGDKAADDMAADMDADGDENGENGEDKDVEDRVVDLEDALDELKAEFEAMMADKNGDEEAEETAIAPVVPAQETQPEMSRFEGKDATKETVKEYKIKKSADNADKADNKSSPVKTGGAKQGGTPVKTGGGAEDKGRPAPTAEKVKGEFANTGGKDSLKTKEVKANNTDGSDKSGKSPIAGK